NRSSAAATNRNDLRTAAGPQPNRSSHVCDNGTAGAGDTADSCVFGQVGGTGRGCGRIAEGSRTTAERACGNRNGKTKGRREGAGCPRQRHYCEGACGEGPTGSIAGRPS